jgi:hypothetical protein
MEFFNTAFISLAPITIILSLFLKNNYKIYSLNILAVVNLLSILCSINIAQQLYSLYQLATIMGFEIYPNNKFVVGWFEVRILLVLLLPFLFLIKKLSDSRLLSVALLCLMLFDVFKNWIKPNTEGFNFTIITFSTNNWFLQIMHYSSWFISLYALLWLIKRLPYSNEVKN